MKKTEKILKQKVTKDVESSLINYSIQYSLNKEKNKLKRISKNQYGLLAIKDSAKDIYLKFPVTITKINAISNLEIKKDDDCIMPQHFRLQNSNFSFNSENIFKNLSKTQNSLLMILRIFLKSKQTSPLE